jgi:hydroxyacylglutathione hydrolase
MVDRLVDAKPLERGVFPRSWQAGAELASGPDVFVHPYNLDVFILRQAGRTHVEKPFLYLLVGAARALLIDTGAPGADVVGAVDAALARWSSARFMPAPPLVVAHTHGHSDHVAGDDRFRARPATTVVGTSVDEVSAFFGLSSWPDGRGAIDLGERPIDVIAVPGHDESSLAFYDRRTGILLSGDVLYPGRLYVRSAEAFRASVGRLVSFTRDRRVAHVLGAHIENTWTPFIDYPEGTAYQPEEHPLELGRAHLLELDAVLQAMGATLERRALRDFTVWPVPGPASCPTLEPGG